MKRSKLFVWAALLLLLLAVSPTVCLASGGKEQAQSKETVKLTVLTHPVLYRSGTGGDEGLIPQFMKETGHEVEVVTGPLEEILEKSLVDFVSGTGSFDIVTYNDRSIHPGLANYFLALDDYVKDLEPSYRFDDILKVAVDVNRLKGKLYGIPFRYGCFMLYYRKDILAKYGVEVPKDYVSMIKGCEKITTGLRSDGVNDAYAIVYGGEPGHGIWEDYVAWLMGHGASIADENGNSLLNSKTSLQTLIDYVTPYQKGWSSPDTPGMTRDKVTSSMQQGKAMMAIIYGGYWGLLVDPEKSKVHDKFGWALPPAPAGVKLGRTNFGGWQFNINKDSKNPDVAWQLVKYLTNPEAAKYVALNHANAPIRASVLEDPDYLAKYPLAKDWSKAFAASELAIPGGHKKIAEIMDTMGYEVADALVAKKTPQQAIDDMHKKVQSILKQ